MPTAYYRCPDCDAEIEVEAGTEWNAGEATCPECGRRSEFEMEADTDGYTFWLVSRATPGDGQG